MSIYGNSIEDRHFNKMLNNHLDSQESEPERTTADLVDEVADLCSATSSVAEIALQMASGDEERAIYLLNNINFIQFIELKEKLSLISDHVGQECFMGLSIDEWTTELIDY